MLYSRAGIFSEMAQASPTKLSLSLGLTTVSMMGTYKKYTSSAQVQRPN